MHTMPSGYQILPCAEDDIREVTSLVISAMHDDLFDQQLFPSTPGFTAEEQTSNRRTWLESLWRENLFNPDAYLLKAVTAEHPSEIAGFACWIFPPGPEAHSNAEETEQRHGVVESAFSDNLPPGINTQLMRECTVKLEAIKASLTRAFEPSAACYHLTMLATHPAHLRKGIASMLFGWAVEQVDAEGAFI